MQRLQGEGRVANPGVAVVPVALAAGRLRERCRERGHRRAGRHVGEALDGQGGALDGIAPAVIGDARLAEPVAPEARGRGEPGHRVVDIGGACELLGPGEGAEGLLALLERVPRPHAVALDAEREVGVQTDRLSCSRGVGDVTAAVDQRPLRLRAAVVERGLADELDLDAALEALDRAHQHVVGVFVGGRPRVWRDLVLVRVRPHGQGGADEHPAGRRPPGRLEDVGAGLVDARGCVVDAERRERERCRRRDRAGCRRHSGSRSAGRTASRSPRRARRGLPCGSSRGTRSPRSE